MDKARSQTEKKLKDLESRIGKVYQNDLALKRLKAQYAKYMESVSNAVEPLYETFQNADNENKAEAKKAYTEAVLDRTDRNKQYQKLVTDLARAIANANQRALDLSNELMLEIYAESHNQIVDDCRKAGIKVNG